MEESAVLEAAFAGDLQRVKTYFDTCTLPGAVAVVHGCGGHNALHLAAVAGRLQVVDYLVRTKRACVHGRTKVNGDTPLHLAAAAGRMTVVRYLVECAGACVDLVDDRWQTPFHCAVESNQMEAVRYLARCSRFGVSVAGFDNTTALYVACKQGHLDVVVYLTGNHQALGTADLRRAVHAAAAAGHADVLRHLVSLDRATAELTSEDGQRALHVAAGRGHEEAVRVLLDEGGARVDARDCFGQTALHFAFDGLHGKVVRLLLEWGADGGVVDCNGRPALSRVAHGPGANAKLGVCARGLTELMSAARSGKLEAVKAAAGAGRVDAQDLNGDAAIHHAVRLRHVEVVRYLSDALGANLGLCNNAGADALRLAVATNSEAVVAALWPAFAAGRRQDLVALAVLENSTAVACRLVAHGPVPCGGVWRGDFMLQEACFRGTLAVVKAVAAADAVDVDAEDRRARTALQVAARADRVDAVRHLVGECGAAVNRVNCRGDTALHDAVAAGAKRAVRVLVCDFGADAAVRNTQGEDPLFVAVTRRGSADLAGLLVSEGRAPAHRHYAFGCRTLLHEAVRRRHPQLVSALLRAGDACINARDAEGRTALHRCCSDSYDPAVLKLLLGARGVDLGARCAGSGQTAAQLAAARGIDDAVRSLAEA